MNFLHTMIRVLDLDKTINFFELLGLKEVRRFNVESGRFTLVFMATEKGKPEVELTYNWDQKENYTNGRNFGHIAFSVDNIYELCKKLQNNGIIINRPPHDGYMAFIKTPDNISIELLQNGAPLPPMEPWCSMNNTGEW